MDYRGEGLKGHEIKRDYAARRAAALVELRERAARGEVDCVARLVERCANEPPLLGLHVWQVERAAFDHSRAACLRHVEQAAAWCGATHVGQPGRVSMAWLLHGGTGGARLAAWLLAVCLDLDGFALSGPDPFHAHTHAATSDPR